MSLPLLIGGVCVLTSIIGTYFVNLGGGKNVMGAMYKGFLSSPRCSVGRSRSGSRSNMRSAI